MRKRQRREERDDIPNLTIESRPQAPVVPPGFVPPPPTEFLQKLKSLGVHQDASEPPKDDGFLTRLRALSSGKSLPVPAMPLANVFPSSGLNFDNLSKIGLPAANKPSHETTTVQTKHSEPETISEILHYTKPIGFGLGVALQYMKDHGILREHKEDEPILEYRDDNGFKITGKDVFKYQSHIFSGKRPSEKHRRRDIARHKAAEMQKMADIGDTPLHSASSLRKALGERKQPFIVLSGENRSVMPYEPVDKHPKKRLRLKKRKQI